MTKPETLKDIIDETIRASGVPYKVPVRDKQFGGDHYKRMGNKDERLQEAQKGLHYQEKLVDTLKKAQDENG